MISGTVKESEGSFLGIFICIQLFGGDLGGRLIYLGS
jgi:hypothetical protein